MKYIQQSSLHSLFDYKSYRFHLLFYNQYKYNCLDNIVSQITPLQDKFSQPGELPKRLKVFNLYL